MKTTLEQWQLLQAVVNYGSFARAATVCHRSQSSLSYQIGLMQQRLGVSLLKVVGRKAELTPMGQQLLAQASPLLRGFQALENRALALKGGGAGTAGFGGRQYFSKITSVYSAASFSADLPVYSNSPDGSIT